MALLNFLLNTALIVVVISIFLVVHQWGHALMYRLLIRNKNYVMTIGAGEPMIRLPRLIINRWFFVGGKIDWDQTQGKRWQHILIHLAGPMINGLFLLLITFATPILAGFISDYSRAGDFIYAIIFAAFRANMLIAIITILPIVYPYGIKEGMISDGMKVFLQLRYGGKKAQQATKEETEKNKL